MTDKATLEAVALALSALHGSTIPWKTDLIRAQAAIDAYEATPSRRVDIDELYAAVAHGDNEHRDWLKEAFEAVAAGKPVPPPRQAAQPDTHVLVPREPTEVMIGAAERIGYHSHRSDFIRLEIEREYKAMIAAHEGETSDGC